MLCVGHWRYKNALSNTTYWMDSTSLHHNSSHLLSQIFDVVEWTSKTKIPIPKPQGTVNCCFHIQRSIPHFYSVLSFLPQEHEQYQVNRAFLEHHVSCVAFCHRPNVSRIGYFVDNDSSNKLGKAQASLALTHLIVVLECRERHSVCHDLQGFRRRVRLILPSNVRCLSPKSVGRSEPLKNKFEEPLVIRKNRANWQS